MNAIVVDACCFINLYATGDVRDVLANLNRVWYVPHPVMMEATRIRVKDQHGDVTHVPIDREKLVRDGLIRTVGVETTDETDLYVRLAISLDDGEAMALALAARRGWELATDDRKARRLAAELNVNVVTTPEIMQEWAHVKAPSPIKLARVLRNIEFGARFFPSQTMPRCEWWLAARRSS